MTARLAVAVAAALLASGCGFGVLQTARPLPPGEMSFTAGAGSVHNSVVDAQQSPREPINVVGDLAFRVGVVDRLDIGIGGLWNGGLRADAKYDLLPTRSRFALSPRGGLGYAAGGGWALTAFGGALASYDVFRWLTPYAGGTYATYWVHGRTPNDVTLASNERFADRKGYGDGLVELTAGLSVQVGRAVALLGEVDRWIPMQNDPGDFFRFVPSTVVMAGMQVTFGKRGEAGE